MKVKDITLSIELNATTQELYDTFMDSEKHSSLISDDATIDPSDDGEFSLWGGSITGTNVELEPPLKIVQKWRYDYEDWPIEYFSEVTFEFEDLGGGRTKLTLTHQGIPESYVKDITEGWNDYYFEPLKELYGSED